MKDTISIARIKELHPKVRDIFQKFIEAAENGLGITIRIVQGLRTFPQQQAIYQQGRTKPGKIVTNAKAGSSFHNYGLAVDLGILEANNINWNYEYKKLQPYAISSGLTWGADWDGDGKTKADGDKDEHLVDMPHYQLTFGHTWQELLSMYNQNKFIADTKYLDI